MLETDQSSRSGVDIGRNTLRLSHPFAAGGLLSPAPGNYPHRAEPWGVHHPARNSGQTQAQEEKKEAAGDAVPQRADAAGAEARRAPPPRPGSPPRPLPASPARSAATAVTAIT